MSRSEGDERGVVTLHSAEVVVGLYGSQPIRNAGIVVDEENRIVAAGPIDRLPAHYDQVVQHQILMPGVLNCHVHMTDANLTTPIPGGSGLNRWVGELLASRRSNGTASRREVADTLLTMQALGTVAIGEVVNDRGTVEGIRESGIRCRYIHELLAFRGEDAAGKVEAALADLPDDDQIRGSLGLHAPYSVSPDLHRLAAEWSRANDRLVYEHLAEDPEERTLYESGAGPWRSMLETIRAWDDHWRPPGVSPIEHLDSLGILDERFVAVHLADATSGEIDLLARRGARAVLSPRSNLHITGLFPPLDAIIASGMRFALGTDGRGSSPSVDVFDEAAAILEHGAEVPAGRLLEALTIDAAAILQMPDLGAFVPGNQPGILSVEISNLSDDVARLEREIIFSTCRQRIDRPIASSE